MPQARSPARFATAKSSLKRVVSSPAIFSLELPTVRVPAVSTSPHCRWRAGKKTAWQRAAVRLGTVQGFCNLAQCLLKDRRGLAARDQVPVVDDDGGHRPNALAAVKRLGRTHLGGKFVAGQNLVGTRHVQPSLRYP